MNFASTNNIFSKCQHGFLKGKSTETAIMNFLNMVYENINNNKKCIGLFMDLSKAFDVVNHNILLEKLKLYGLRGKIHDWLQSYLLDRTQVVEINGIKSEMEKVAVGVPQGSVLGPLLFLFYINDLPCCLPEDNLVMFADDTSYLVSNNSLEVTKLNTQEIINSFSSWFLENRLFLNVSKTYFINFTPRISAITQSSLLRINGKSVEQVSTTKFLGIFIDNALNWEPHTEFLSKKLTSVCYALYRLQNISNRTTALSYYYAHFYSRMSYGIMFWGNSHNADRIFKLQKKAIRNIANVSRYHSCRDLFKTLKILPLACIYILKISIYVKTNISEFTTNSSIHEYCTRGGNNLVIPYHRLSTYEQNPGYIGIKIYNKLPLVIRNLDNIHNFRSKLKVLLHEKSYYSLQDFLNE